MDDGDDVPDELSEDSVDLLDSVLLFAELPLELWPPLEEDA